MYFVQSGTDTWVAEIPTKTVLDCPVATLLVEQVHLIMGFCDESRFKMEFCLQEGLQNAAVHGNLQFDKSVFTVEDFEAMQAFIQHQLTQEPFSTRHVGVVLRQNREGFWWEIKDEGKGFSLQNLQKQTVFGRGLSLISEFSDAFHYNQEKTTLEIFFRACPETNVQGES
jgi:anti-sigma regulatory factor (Ser/Thr protein kinase)